MDERFSQLVDTGQEISETDFASELGSLKEELDNSLIISLAVFAPVQYRAITLYASSLIEVSVIECIPILQDSF